MTRNQRARRRHIITGSIGAVMFCATIAIATALAYSITGG